MKYDKELAICTVSLKFKSGHVPLVKAWKTGVLLTHLGPQSVFSERWGFLASKKKYEIWQCRLCWYRMLCNTAPSKASNYLRAIIVLHLAKNIIDQTKILGYMTCTPLHTCYSSLSFIIYVSPFVPVKLHHLKDRV